MIERMNETNEDCHRSILKLNLLVKYKITTHLSTHASIVYSYSFLRTTIQQKKKTENQYFLCFASSLEIGFTHIVFFCVIERAIELAWTVRNHWKKCTGNDRVARPLNHFIR